MKVYILEESYCGDHFVIPSVHSTEDGAKKRMIDLIEKDVDRLCQYHISERRVMK